MHKVMIQAGSRLWLQIGSTTVGTQMQDYPLEKASLPIRRRDMASPMMLQATSFAQLIMIGMIHSTLFATFSHLVNSLNPSSRVHANHQDAALGYNHTCGFFLNCLYLDDTGDPKDPKEGFLKGPLLMHVSSKASLLDWTLNQ
jgi:hypothetical protein